MQHEKFKTDLNFDRRIDGNISYDIENGSNIADLLPCRNKPIDAPSGICRTGGWEQNRIAAERGKDIPVVAVEGLLTVAEDRGDRCGVENDGQIVRNNVPDGTVGAAFNGTATDAVPKRNVVSFQKNPFLGDG